MGNDGGSIPDRRDLVRNKKKEESLDKANRTRARWGFCALSKRPLQEPVVACALGKLYNKDAIIEFLLNRDAYGDGNIICGHIRSLKDVKTLVLTPNTAPVNTSQDPSERVKFICPLTLKEMNGLTPFVYLRACGCVFAAAGLSEMRAEGEGEKETCPQCATKYTHSDRIPINPTLEEEQGLRELLAAQRLLEPVKKSKKRKAAVEPETEPAAKKSAPLITTASNTLRSTLALEEAKRKAGMSDAVRSLYSNKGNVRQETFMTRGTFTRYA